MLLVLLLVNIGPAALIGPALGVSEDQGGDRGPSLNVEITLDPASTYQTFTGWEAHAYAADWPGHSPAYPDYIDELFDRIDDEFGINRLAIQVHAGAENPTDYAGQFLRGELTEPEWAAEDSYVYETINDNDDPFLIDPEGFHFTLTDHQVDNFVLPFKERLEARGERFYLTVCYVDFYTTGWGHYNHLDEYAELVLATYQHLDEKYGLEPDVWEVILEPDNSAWTGAMIGEAVLKAGKRLEDAGYQARFRAPSNTNTARAATYFDEMAVVLGEENVKHYMREISYHRYEEGSDATVGELAERAERYGLTTSMTEWMWADRYDLHSDLKWGCNTVWGGHGIAGKYPDFDFYRIEDDDPNDPAIILNENAKYWRHYIRYIRDGAVRIGAETNNADFDPVAFINSDGRYVVVVNTGSGGSVSLKGLPPGTYGTRYTTSTDHFKGWRDITVTGGEPLRTSIPSRGVITIFQIDPLSQLGFLPAEPEVRMTVDNITTFKVIGGDQSSELSCIWRLDGQISQGDRGTEFVYAPSPGEEGVHIINVTVMDVSKGVDPRHYEWTVTVDRENQAPMLVSFSPPRPVSVVEEAGGIIVFTVEIEDPDDDVITYTWYVNEQVQDGAIGSEFYFNYGFSSGGNHTVRVVATDNIEQLHWDWDLRIEDLNRDPLIVDHSPAASVALNLSETVTFQVTARDPDDDILVYRWYLNDELIVDAIGPSYTYAHVPDADGINWIEANISDPWGGTASQEWMVLTRGDDGDEGSSDGGLLDTICTPSTLIMAVVVSAFILVIARWLRSKNSYTNSK